MGKIEIELRIRVIDEGLTRRILDSVAGGQAAEVLHILNGGQTESDVRVEPVSSKARNMKPLGDCERHGAATQRSESTNRCILCDGERHLARTKVAQQAPQEEQKSNGAKSALPVMWSKPVECPQCGIGYVRLHRSTVLNGDGYWVHDQFGRKPCLLRVDATPHVQDDPSFNPPA
jgi:hypothetical protein